MTALPDWMRPPCEEGWFAEDLDYELDEPTGAYAPAGIFRGTLQRSVPFETSLDLDKLTPPRPS